VETPHYRSPAPVGDEARPHPVKLSANSAEFPVAASASLDELRREWRRLYHRDPPRISRDLLIRGIGCRLQEIQHGGLSKATRRKLKTLAKMFRTEGRVAPDPGLSLKPGALLPVMGAYATFSGFRFRKTIMGPMHERMHPTEGSEETRPMPNR
jgi:hypothetical protein